MPVPNCPRDPSAFQHLNPVSWSQKCLIASFNCLTWGEVVDTLKVRPVLQTNNEGPFSGLTISLWQLLDL
uniref:Uncharacterized protein n=1 Tax=Magallana gigas TaxID=29159 RepID=K1PDN2_MAGGI